MAVHQFFAYSTTALVYNSTSNTWSLRPDYNFTLDRVEILITDGDSHLDGDWVNDEIGDDTTQFGQVYDLNGNLIKSGQIYDERYYELRGPAGQVMWVERIEIAGQHVGYIVSVPLEKGVSYPQVLSANVGTALNTGTKDTRLAYVQATNVPCFGSGVHLETDQGPVPVDWLATGDRVLTLDHGYQPILWIGRTRVSAADLAANPALRPVILPAGRFGAEGPERDLVLSPEHRVLVASAAIEMHFGTHEALAPCKFLHPAGGERAEAGGPVAAMSGDDGFSYYHVLFEQHEIVRAEGLWVESLFTGDMALGSLDDWARQGVEEALRSHGGTRAMQSARYVLRRWEAELLGLSSWSDAAAGVEGARYGSKIA